MKHRRKHCSTAKAGRHWVCELAWLGLRISVMSPSRSSLPYRMARADHPDGATTGTATILRNQIQLSLELEYGSPHNK